MTSPKGIGFKYQLGARPFQSSPEFFPLVAGNYTLTIKNEDGCTQTIGVVISSIPAGSLFTAVKDLFGANCVSCHGGANPQAGLDFSKNCDIINNWSRIKERAVDGNPSSMPQGGLLPLNERNKIISWINAGHRFSD